jgi:hypothetical protein
LSGSGKEVGTGNLILPMATVAGVPLFHCGGTYAEP